MNSPYVIIGLGKSGSSAKNYLLAQGIATDQIFTFDEKQPSDLKTWDDIHQLQIGTLIVSPGVPLKSKPLQSLVQKGWSLSSEIDLACSVLTDEIIIGITGSVGKSTVTSLIGEGLKATNSTVFVGGNLGIPFCEYAISVLNHQPKARYVVLELSSYQLENCKNLQLDYSVISYLSANHLERYNTKEDYYLTKCAISKKTKNLCLLNETSKDLVQFKEHIKSPYELINFEKSAFKDQILRSKLIGYHNYDNVALAFRLGQVLQCPAASFERILNFSGLPHRLENLGHHNGILFINDSKATAMDSVLVATEAALTQIENENQNLFLLLGGKDKNLPWDQLSTLKKYKNIRFVFFGECGDHAQKLSTLTGFLFKTLDPALEYIFAEAKNKDVVLLSPGGTSLDEFKNFEDRGHHFKQKVLAHYSSK